MDKHRDKTLDSLIGALVEITFTDNKVIKGVLGYTEQFSGQYSYKKTHYYTCDNYSFRKSHVKKARGLIMT